MNRRLHGTTGNIKKDLFESKQGWGVNDNVAEKNKLASQMIHKRCKYSNYFYFNVNLFISVLNGGGSITTKN